MNALRSLPLSVLAYVSMPNDWNQLLNWLRIVTLGVYRFAQGTPSEKIDVKDDRVSLIVSPDELTYAEEHLAHDLARLIGAAFAREQGKSIIAWLVRGETAEARTSST